MAEKKPYNPNQEIEDYRNLLETPSEFEDGFTKPAILGVLFVAFVMIPGNMYLNLMVGGNLGAAAEWVTIILFAEVTKRSFITLKRQEVYLLYYVAAGLIAAEHGTFDGLLWPQYLVQSPAAEQFGIAKLIPDWWAPPADSPALAERTFLHPDWIRPIILVVSGFVIMRISWFTMSYMLFRVNSDYERLPFPFAPVAAQGATALAESSRGEETWRWRVFSSGAMIGLVFGAIYVGIPAITGALLTEPIQLIPIPWIDFTQITGNFIPATPLGFTAHLGPIFAGMVMPFWGVVGTFVGVVSHSILNPILYNHGVLQIWQPGMGAVETFFVNSVDFWMSFGIGVTVAIALIGTYQVVRGVRSTVGQAKGEGRTMKPPEGRGDFPLWGAFGLYCLATAGLISIAWMWLPAFKQFVWFFLFFGFIFTPFQSFVNARLVGMVGKTVSIPFIKEATIILSGYQGVDIWFIPFPLGNYGAQTQKFREIELTGTKFTSIAKAEMFMLPIVLATTFLYSAYIWKLAPVPSASYPYAQLMWRLRALQTCIWYTGTMTSQLERDDATREATWQPANLIDEEWWHWRVRLVSPEFLRTNGKRGEAGPWTDVRRFYTHYREGAPEELPPPPLGGVEPEGRKLAGPALEVLGPEADGGIIRTARPEFYVKAKAPVPEGWRYYFSVDTDPNFTSPWIQRSTDEPWLFRAINKNTIMAGTITGLSLYILLSVLGLPVLMVFGYVRALTIIPHMMVTEMVGALLARYYFWNKYGQRQWRLYAPILAVGFAAGMALMGMASIAIALIQKSVSVLVF